MDRDHLSTFLSLRAIKRDLLVALDRKGSQYGLEIKETLDAQRETELTIGRLYPNLDELAEQNLITKDQLTKRANRYEITDYGQQVLHSYRSWVGPSETIASPRHLQRSISLQLNAPGEENE